jgi:hypothetical protein
MTAGLRARRHAHPLALASPLARLAAICTDTCAIWGGFSSAEAFVRAEPHLHWGRVEVVLMKQVVRNLAVATMCTTLASSLAAQRTLIGPSETATATATIRRIDPVERFVSLRGDDGSEVGVFVPQEFGRFKELRVGDTVTVTYYESIVYQLRRPGAAKPPVSEEAAATESQAALPGGTLSRQTTERVTVRAIDRQAPSISVIGRNGRTTSRHVERASDLDGVKPGDQIDITYTEAVLVTVARAK